MEPDIHVEGDREVVADRWRWRAKDPVRMVGRERGVLVVQERLGANTVRLTGLEESSGRPLWSAVHGGVQDQKISLYGRAVLLSTLNRLNGTPSWSVVDALKGRTVLTTGATLRSQGPRQMLWAEILGPPPYEGGRTLSLVRLDPTALRGRRLDLPLAQPSGIAYDEQPIVDLSVEGDRIDLRCAGTLEATRKPAQFLVRYRWSAGPRQKPEIQMLDQPTARRKARPGLARER